MTDKDYSAVSLPPTLPGELIVFEILGRATAKVVGRSKSVCKYWYALLSTQDFITTHTIRSSHPSNQRTLVIDNLTGSTHHANFDTCECGPPTPIACPFTQHITNISVLSQLDGLLCVWAHDTHALYLWNPTTTKYNNLATTDERGIYVDSSDKIAIFKDPFTSYSVLHIHRTSTAFECSIYSCQTATWRTVPFTPNVEYLPRNYYWSPGTQCSNTIYFTVYDFCKPEKAAVLTFHIPTAQAGELSFPPIESRGILVANLINIEGALHMFVTTGLNEMTIQLWVLRLHAWTAVSSTNSAPPIPVRVWSASTHYITNGQWFLMAQSMKVCEIPTAAQRVKRFHSVPSTSDQVATVYLETLVPPGI